MKVFKFLLLFILIEAIAFSAVLFVILGIDFAAWENELYNVLQASDFYIFWRIVILMYTGFILGVLYDCVFREKCR